MRYYNHQSMKTIQMMLLLALAGLAWQCEQDDPGPNLNPPAEVFSCVEQADACDLAFNNNAFGFDLFRQLHSDDPAGNIFLSPLSISAALSMTANGALEDELADMRTVLHQDAMTEEQINEAYKYYLEILPEMAPNVTMLPANSIWYHHDFNVYAEFLQANADYFQAAIEARDFRDEATVAEINDWIADKTNDRIQDMIQSIPADAVMYLINAVFFQGNWRYQFPADETFTTDFTAFDGSLQPTPMMTFGKKVTLPYTANNYFQIIDLPYADSVFSMTLLLPHTTVDLDEAIAQLNADHWDQWISSLHSQEGIVQLPRFSLEYEQELKEPLRAIGMESGWTEWGPNRMTDDPRVQISKVKHKAFLEVNVLCQA
jgi:serine protease inhibitor